MALVRAEYSRPGSVRKECLFLYEKACFPPFSGGAGCLFMCTKLLPLQMFQRKVHWLVKCRKRWTMA